MLPVYVINLDRRPDRWATISENLARLDLAAERITAVDARALPPQSAKIDLGAVACARSHAIAMTRLLDSSAPASLILEDDVEVATDTPALLESTDWWPPGAKVVRLEVQGKHPQQLWRRGGQTPTGRALHKLERWGNCAGAYLINREGAQMALPHCLNPVMPQDHILFDHRISLLARALRTFQIVPGMATQKESDSDLYGYREAAELRGLKRHGARLKHALHSLPYKTKLQYWKLRGWVRPRRVDYHATPNS